MMPAVISAFTKCTVIDLIIRENIVSLFSFILSKNWNKNLFLPRIARGMQRGKNSLFPCQILAKCLFMTYFIFYQDVSVHFGYLSLSFCLILTQCGAMPFGYLSLSSCLIWTQGGATHFGSSPDSACLECSSFYSLQRHRCKQICLS